MILMVACNDYRNGVFEGRASCVEGAEMRFDCQYVDWSPRFLVNHKKGYLRLCGVKLPFKGETEHHGNWCWNAYGVSKASFLTLINSERFRKCFQLIEAPTEMYEAWEQKKLVSV